MKVSSKALMRMNEDDPAVAQRFREAAAIRQMYPGDSIDGWTRRLRDVAIGEAIDDTRWYRDDVDFTGPVGIPVGTPYNLEVIDYERRILDAERDVRLLEEARDQRNRWRFASVAALLGLAAIPTYNMYKQYTETRKAKQIESHVHRNAVPTVRQLQLT
jgi:hypothetical protein